MRRTKIVSTLAAATLPALGFAQVSGDAPSYCRSGYQPEMIKINGSAGAYMRVSPDGNYAIVSNGTSNILDLTGKDSDGNRVTKEIRTRMNNEAYPVEGNWNYVAAPGGQMSFYRFKDLLEKGTEASPGEIVDNRPAESAQESPKPKGRRVAKNKPAPSVTPAPTSTPGSSPYQFYQTSGQTSGQTPGEPERFVDREHTVQWYHSAAELPGGDKKHATYRVSLFSENTMRDYEVWFNPDGSAAKVEKKPIKPLCQNIVDKGNTFSDRLISQPIISKDGTEMAGLWHNTTHIFKIKDDGSCEVEDDLGISSYKVSFSYPEPGKRSKIVFTNASMRMRASSNGSYRPSQAFNNFGTYIYDPNTKKMTPLSIDPLRGVPNYPGWTKDGHILAQMLDPQSRSQVIAVINPKKLIPVPDLSQVPDTKAAKDCFQDAETYTRAVASLGEVWNSVCSQYNPGSRGGNFMQALSLDPKDCVKMVHENYQSWKDQHPSSELSEQHLAVACKTSH